MKSRAPWPVRNEAIRLALVVMLAVSAGYLVRLPMAIPMSSGILSALCTENFHDLEGNYRWTRGRSSVVFPGPGPGLSVQVEVHVSGFRPRGQDPPLVVIEASGQRLQARPGRGDTLTLETKTQGWWSSDLEVRFRSETFIPGEYDRRSLGIRVHEARVVPQGFFLGIGRAPLRQLIIPALGVLLFFTLLLQRGWSPERARRIGYALAVVWGLGVALAKSYAALTSLPFLAITALAVGLNWLFPSAATVLNETIRESACATAKRLGELVGLPSVTLVILGALGVMVAYLARPSFEIDLGSGRETILAERFAGFDQERTVKFRRALRGARIDLSDFGGGSTWKIAVTASVETRSQNMVLSRVDKQEIEASLTPGWSTHELESYAPLGWRSGPVVEFPSASEAGTLRVNRVSIERGRSLPSLRILAFVVGSALLVWLGSAACGLRGISTWLAAGSVLALELVALMVDPLLAVPFVPTFFAACAGGALWMSLAFSFLTALARRGITPNPVPVAVAAVGLGFIAWLSCTLFPLYQGGHFVFHSSIAEEIWQGEFLTYYLPFPGSMLSRQAQWGSIVVPHSCLYHTLVSPLAALPRGWFFGLEKVGLALMLTAVSLVATLIATATGTRRAGAFAGVFAASLPPTFQLLGQGHLMTLFGVFAAALALGLIVLRFDHLQERSTWWWVTGLLTLCFLSYTASLLMAVVTLFMAIPLLFRRAPEPTRALTGAVIAAAIAAFFLYYVNWTLPFLRESLPRILFSMGPETDEIAFWSRLAALPGKLAYTYGHAALPLAGLAGLTLVRPGSHRVLLACWAGMLVLFSGLDLYFNFLLKHHYFVIPVVTAGCGLLAAWLFRKGRWGQVLSAIWVFYMILLGGRAALSVALG